MYPTSIFPSNTLKINGFAMNQDYTFSGIVHSLRCIKKEPILLQIITNQQSHFRNNHDNVPPTHDGETRLHSFWTRVSTQVQNEREKVTSFQLVWIKLGIPNKLDLHRSVLTPIYVDQPTSILSICNS